MSIEERLAEAVKQAKIKLENAISYCQCNKLAKDCTRIQPALTRYGDLRALEARWQTYVERNGPNSYRRGEIEAALEQMEVVK